MNKLIRAEWIKLRSVRTTWLLAIVSIVLAIGITALATASVEDGAPSAERFDLLLSPAPLLVRLFMLVLGILAFANEYRHGTIVPTLAAAPIRNELLGAKLVVLGAFGLILGAVVTLVSIVTGLTTLSLVGQPVSVFDGEIPRAIAGTVAFYGICAALGVGAGVLVRQPSIAIGVVHALGVVRRDGDRIVPAGSGEIPAVHGRRAALRGHDRGRAPGSGCGRSALPDQDRPRHRGGSLLFQRRDVG